jgi:hypothetical protein
MIKISYLLSGALLFATQLFAQENGAGSSGFELGIYHNMSSELPINFSATDWNTAVTNFEQVESGYSTISQSSYYWNYSNPFTYLRGTFDYGNRTNDSWVKPKLAFTFGAFNNIYLSNNFDQYKQFRYDTLTSSQTGNQTFVDSVYQINRHRSFDAKMISFGIGAHFEKAITKRFSAEFGFDVLYTFAMNSRVSAHQYTSSGTTTNTVIDSYYSNYNYYGFNYGRGENLPTNESAKMNVSILSIQLPIEFNMLLSTKENIFNQFKLGVTYNPTFSFATLNEVKRSYFSAPVGVTLKYHFK